MISGTDGYAELQPLEPTVIRLAFHNCTGCYFSVATAGWPERYPAIAEDDVVTARTKLMSDNPHSAVVIDIFQAKTLG